MEAKIDTQGNATEAQGKVICLCNFILFNYQVETKIDSHGTKMETKMDNMKTEIEAKVKNLLFYLLFKIILDGL